MIYWNQGARKREQYVAEGTLDPIFERKPFPASGMTYSTAARSSHRRRAA